MVDGDDVVWASSGSVKPLHLCKLCGGAVGLVSEPAELAGEWVCIENGCPSSQVSTKP